MTVNMKNRKKWKTASALLLAAAMFGNGMLQAGAVTEIPGNPETKTPLDSYTEAQMLCFGDNILEYWEIQGLVEHYNPTYLKT